LKKVNIKRILIYISLTVVMIFIGCGKSKIEGLKEENLFRVPIGSGEEEIGILRKSDGTFSGPSNIIFANGFFFVVDDVNQKIMKITTPGDVILVISKGEELKPDDNVLRTKERKYFNFNKIGKITVDNENNLYVEDKVLQKMPEKTEIDIFNAENNDKENDSNDEIWVSYILKFDRLGNFLYKIGKNGINSEPLYFLYKMEVDKKGSLVVLSTDENWENWVYNRIDSSGNLVVNYNLSSDKIIGEKNLEGESFFILDAYPMYGSNSVLFWISLYDTSNDTKKSKKEEDIWGEEIEIENYNEKEKEDANKKENKRDLLYYKLLFYNLDTDEVDRVFRWENRITDNAESTQEFFGLDKSGNSFFWKYKDNRSAVVSIIRPNGTVIERRKLFFKEDGIWTNINVTGVGFISGIKVDNKFLNFYRWRSDRLINTKMERTSLKDFFREKIEEFKNANR